MSHPLACCSPHTHRLPGFVPLYSASVRSHPCWLFDLKDLRIAASISHSLSHGENIWKIFEPREVPEKITRLQVTMDTLKCGATIDCPTKHNMEYTHGQTRNMESSYAESSKSSAKQTAAIKAARKSLQQCSRPQFHCDVSNVAGATENSRRTTDKPQPNELT